jgi:serine/threonine protein kinase
VSEGYRIIGHLARGNRLDIYDAWSVVRHSRCVLKTLRPDRASDGAARRALTREGRLLTRLAHPHLVRAYELTMATDDGRAVVILETLEGETLSHMVHRLDASGRLLPLGDVAVLGSQLASVLAYLHDQGWLHLDVKPANIVISGGRARLIDLSIAHRPGRVAAGTGTYEYMSPEQARGGHVSRAADVWGLGAVLHTALIGVPPYEPLDEADPDVDATRIHGGTTSLTGARTLDTAADEDDPGDYPQLVTDPAPVGRRRRVPRALGGIVDACLARDPLARPSLAEVTSRLETWLGSRVGPP